MRRCSCDGAGPQRSCVSPLQVRHGSAFTESLGGHTGSEAGTAQGDPEEDISAIALTERSSASRAASGEGQRHHDWMAVAAVHADTPSPVTWMPSHQSSLLA